MTKKELISTTIMRIRKRKQNMIRKKNGYIDMVQRYDGVYSPYWESDFVYFVNKMISKFRNLFKR